MAFENLRVFSNVGGRGRRFVEVEELIAELEPKQKGCACYHDLIKKLREESK